MLTSRIKFLNLPCQFETQMKEKKIAIEYLTSLPFKECVEKANSKIEQLLDSSFVSDLGLEENEKIIMKNHLKCFTTEINKNFQLLLNST